MNKELHPVEEPPAHLAASSDGARERTSERALPLTEPSPVVLVVDADPQIRAFVRGAIESHGYQMLESPTAAEGIRQALAYTPDFMVVDLELPDGGGELVVQRVREHTAVPILIVSTHGAESRKVSVLDAGADDYLTKPFGGAELVARIRAALRKVPSRNTSHAVRIGEDIVVDLARRRVIVRGEPVHLTPIEFKLLTTLARSAGTVLTHHRLLDEVWGPGHEKQMQYLRVYMTRLRHKLEREPARPRHLLTETGIGYRLRPGLDPECDR